MSQSTAVNPASNVQGNANPTLAQRPAVTSAPPFTIQTVQNKDRYINLLVYGPYGVGKTTLAGSSVRVPQMQDVIVIDAEAGDLSLLDTDFENVDTIRCKSYKEVARAQEFLKAHCAARDRNDVDAMLRMEQMLKPGTQIDTPKRYRTVIIDSLTEVETFCMYQLLGITDQTKIDEEVQNAEFAEYKRNHSMIQRLVRSFRDLPMNVIMIAAAQYTQDEQKRMVFGPQLTGKLAKQVQGFMDMVGFLVTATGEEGKSVRRMMVQPNARYDAKNRFAVYKQEHFENPTMESILKAVGLYDSQLKNP